MPEIDSVNMATAQSITKDTVTVSIKTRLQEIQEKCPVFLKPVVSYLINDVVPVLGWSEKHVGSQIPFLLIQRLTGIPSFTFAIAFLGALILFLHKCLLKNAQLTCNLLTVLYPAFQTLTAIHNPNDDDYERWLTYWPIFGLLTISDHASSFILRKTNTYFLPKILFLYWISNKNGSSVLNRHLLCHLVAKKKITPIDRALPNEPSQETLFHSNSDSCLPLVNNSMFMKGSMDSEISNGNDTVSC